MTISGVGRGRDRWNDANVCAYQIFRTESERENLQREHAPCALEIDSQRQHIEELRDQAITAWEWWGKSVGGQTRGEKGVRVRERGGMGGGGVERKAGAMYACKASTHTDKSCDGRS